MRKFFLFCLMALLGLTMARAATAADAILERSYFKDDTAQRTLEEVQKLPFSPYEGLLTHGYHREVAYWLKLKIRGGDETAPAYVLRVRPSWHDDIRLFDPIDPNPTSRVTGDRYPWSFGEFNSLSNGFLLKKTAQDREVFIRVQSVHTYMIDVQALEQTEAIRADWSLQSIYIGYMGVLCVAIIWATMSFLRRPEPVIATFALYQVLSFFYCALLFGLLRILLENHLPGPWLDQITIFNVLLTTSVGLAFHMVLFAQHNTERWCKLLLKLAPLPSVVAFMLYFSGETTWALNMNSLGIVLAAFLFLIASWYGISESKTRDLTTLSRRSLRFFYSLIFIVAIFGASPLLGWLNAGEITLGLFLLHSAVVTIVMGLLLNNRQRRINEQHIEQAAIEKNRAELERRARLEQSQFTSMLNHELKTPLSVLKLLIANHPQQALGETTIDSMAALMERCLMTDRLEHDKPLRKSEFSVNAALEAALKNTRQRERFHLDTCEPHILYNDPDLFDIILGNLLDNALKYSPTNSTITVSIATQRLQNQAFSCVSICNNIGRAGVPDLERMFDKYYRADSARTVTGTGLGLYLVKSFADMMGGHVDCTIDQVSKQTIRYTLCLPR